MKKTFLFAMLIQISVGGQALAQDNVPITWKPTNTSRTEATFNSPSELIQHRHIVSLEKGVKIGFELCDIRDYDILENLDSIISTVSRDINFYRDSVSSNDYQSVRIDYLADNTYKNKQLRFTKHPYSSEVFIEKKGTLSRLRIEQDTIRIRIYPPPTPRGPSKHEFKTLSFRGFPVQVTILLNNYADLEAIAKENDLNKIVDTLSKLTAPKTKREQRGYWAYKTSAQMIYDENGKAVRFSVRHGMPNEKGIMPGPSHHLNFYGNIGAGLIRNKLAPMAEAGLEYRWHWVKGEPNYASVCLFTSPYFLFEKNLDGSYRTYDSWFINAAIGEFAEMKNIGSGDQKMFMGMGYLVNPNGMAFKNTSMKLFMSIRLMQVITFAPEIIATDNFKSIFPGLSLKVF